MPSWTDKDETQYEHIKQNQLERGADEDDAKEVAARTVNKQRRKDGKTPNESTQGTGNPDSPYEDRTVNELRNLAAEKDIDGRSKMDKSDLIDALRRHRN